MSFSWGFFQPDARGIYPELQSPDDAYQTELFNESKNNLAKHRSDAKNISDDMMDCFSTAFDFEYSNLNDPACVHKIAQCRAAYHVQMAVFDDELVNVLANIDIENEKLRQIIGEAAHPEQQYRGNDSWWLQLNALTALANEIAFNIQYLIHRHCDLSCLSEFFFLYYLYTWISQTKMKIARRRVPRNQYR